MGRADNIPKDAQALNPDEELLTFKRKARTPVASAAGSVANVTRGEVDLKADAYRSLLEVFTRRTGKQVHYLDYVRAIVDRKTKRLLLIPEEAENDETATLLNTGSSHRLFLGRILVPAKLAVEKGYTEVYTCYPDTDPRFGEVLVVDFASLEERRSIAKKQAKGA